MAVRQKKSAVTSWQIVLEQITVWLHPYLREIVGVLLVLFTIITLLPLLSLSETAVSLWWANIFFQLFGWGAVPVAILPGVLGILLILGRLKESYQTLPYDIIIGVELLAVVALSTTHLAVATNSDYALRLARQGEGGGFVGWGTATFFVDVIGTSFTTILLFGMGVVALGLIFRLTASDIANQAGYISNWAKGRLNPSYLPPDDKKITSQQETKQPSPTVTTAKANPLQKPAMKVKEAIAALPKTKHRLPPLDLLSAPVKDTNQNANTRYQAQIIEETLQGFGIPVEVVEINRGPTVTQFGLKLGTTERKLQDGTVVQQRTRVNKVVALTNDLALALSVAPIRIEAPVPGRPLVGIEAPNNKKTLVSLRSVIEDKEFKKRKGGLWVALGKDVSGQPVSASLPNMPHLLIAGATGSGKSVCLNAIISTLLITHGPEQLRFLMIDPKMVELTSFNGIPHLIAPVVTDFTQVAGALAWATREMERRYKLFAGTGARSIDSYNQKVGASGEQLPYLLVIIDELADLMMMAPDEVERHICRIAQMARATGIHLVIATQRPSTDVVTGLIKANFPTRIAFAVSSQIDSRVILDTPGAEKLLGQGDMLYMASNSPKLARLQGCFLSDTEINNIVQFWKASKVDPIKVQEAESQEVEKLPWADIVAEAGKDELTEKAIKIIVADGRASTSFLQRRLGIGYPRASRLIDQLEADGIIGPADGSKPRELLLSTEDTPI